MRNVFKKILILMFILYTTVSQINSQNKSITKVDINTYELYKNSDWEGLIKEGKSALKVGVDYFYLRMRIGYAYFMQGKYRQAILHYKKAILLNPKDVNAQYFLIKSYEYSGRNNEALRFSKNISSKNLPDISNKYKNNILKAGIIYSYATANPEDIKTEITTGNDLSVYGIQKATNYFHNTNIFVSHKLGRSVIINHSLDYLYKSDYSFLSGDNDFISNNDQSLNQWIYNLNFQINPIGGFTINPGLNFVNITIPVDENAQNDISKTSILYNFKLQQEFAKATLGISIFNGELNEINLLQIGSHLTWYPKANLNLYYTLDAYWHQQKDDQNKENNFVHKHTLGLKMSKYWWTETSILFPEINNFYDFSNAALYNSLEGTKKAISMTNIFLLKNSNISFLAGVSLNTNISSFVPTDYPLSKSNSLSYNKLTFTGGIIWKL